MMQTSEVLLLTDSHADLTRWRLPVLFFFKQTDIATSQKALTLSGTVLLLGIRLGETVRLLEALWDTLSVDSVVKDQCKLHELANSKKFFIDW